MKEDPSEKSLKKMWRYAEKFAEKSGTHLHPQREITEAVVLGLADNIDNYGRPICPCNFYPEKVKVELMISGNKIIFVLGVGSSVAMAIFALMMFLRN